MIDKDNKNIDTFNIPESIIPENSRLFQPNWNNRPPHQKNVIKIQGKRVLTTGNLLAIVSKAGTGKSSVCEAIMANLLNPNSDSLGFSLDLTDNGGRNKVLYIDTERTQEDSWKGWERVYKRATISAPTIDNRVLFFNSKAISVTERKTIVSKILLDNNDIGLVIFDGATDFIRDTNSIYEATEFIDWINTFNPAISIVVTIHTNPNDTKPRGHIGSELCRRAESVFLIRKLDNGIREITTQFDNGKVRNDNDEITSYYQYSNDFEMFISSDYKPKNGRDKEKFDINRDMAEEIFLGKSILSASFIIDEISRISGKSITASKSVFHRYFVQKLVEKSENGYKLII